MKYLDSEKLKLINEREFQKAHPYPWMGIQELLTHEGFIRLGQEYPSLKQLRLSIGESRGPSGQMPHDRYELRSETRPTLLPAWREFLRELNGKEYRNFVRRMFSVKWFELRFQWQVSLPNSSISPHHDGQLKIGNHLFYFNTALDWDESWGGELEIYDSQQKIPENPNPTRESFAHIYSYPIMNNRSVIFERTDHSWHGVDTIRAPKDACRKLFTVVIEKPRPLKTRIKDFLFDTVRGSSREAFAKSVINQYE